MGVALCLSLALACVGGSADAAPPSPPVADTSHDIDRGISLKTVAADNVTDTSSLPQPEAIPSAPNDTPPKRTEALHVIADATGDVASPKGDLTATKVSIDPNHTITFTNYVSSWTYPYSNDWRLDDTESLWIIDGGPQASYNLIAGVFNINGQLYAEAYPLINGQVVGPAPACLGTPSFSSAQKSYSATFPQDCMMSNYYYLRWWARMAYHEHSTGKSTVDDAPDLEWSPWILNDQRLGGPMPPGQPIGTPIPGGVSLTWTAPVNSGGSAIREYRVYDSTDNGATWNFYNPWSTPTVSITLTLPPGQHVFRVTAINVAGYEGNISETSAPYSPLPGIPADAPSRPWVLQNNPQYVHWLPPANQGTYPIEGYYFATSTDDGATWTETYLGSANNTSWGVFTVTSGATYIFRVAASNLYSGKGPWSETSSPVVASLSLSAPTDVRAYGIHQYVMDGLFVQWNPPPTWVGDRVYAYDVQYREVGSPYTMTREVSCSFMNPCTYADIVGFNAGLYAGMQVELRVAARGSTGLGPWSDFTGPYTVGASDAGALPGAPTSVVAVPKAGRAQVSWTAPVDEGGTAVHDYRVTVTDADGNTPSGVIGNTSRLVGAAVTTFEFTGLTDGVSYRFNVQATNLAGFGELSELSPAQTIGAPEYTSLTPSRLMDTRPGRSVVDANPAYQGVGALPAGATFHLQVGGRGGVPVSAAAVTLNFTAVDPAANGFLTVFPCDQPRPNASNVNYSAGVNIPNLALVKPAADGSICVYTSKATHVIADVTGYMPAVAPFTALTPARLLDTRPIGVTVDHQMENVGTLDGGQVLTLPVTGRAGVTDGAGAAVLNITAVNPTAKGYLTVYPCDQPRPTSSSLNFTAGVNIAGFVLASTSATGTVCIFTSQTTHLIADVSGFMPPGGTYHALVPARLADTRATGSTIDHVFQQTSRPAGGWEHSLSVPISGRGGVATGSGAVVLTVTAVNPHATGYISVWTCGQGTTASNVNFTAGVNIANTVIVQPSSMGEICVLNSVDVDIIIDVSGYFPPV